MGLGVVPEGITQPVRAVSPLEGLVHTLQGDVVLVPVVSSTPVSSLVSRKTVLSPEPLIRVLFLYRILHPQRTCKVLEDGTPSKFLKFL